jgi:hypothetical protein
MKNRVLHEGYAFGYLAVFFYFHFNEGAIITLPGPLLILGPHNFFCFLVLYSQLMGRA